MRLPALLLALGVALVAQAARAQAPPLEPAPADLDAAELVQRAAAAFTGAQTYAEAVLSVREREAAAPEEFGFRAWRERRSGRVFLRVIEPRAEAGTGFLRLPPVLWRYAPLTASVERVEDARLREPWLGSLFTLADALDPPAALGSAPARLLGVEPAADAEGRLRAYVLELKPDPEAAGGRVIAWLEAQRLTPLRYEWRDAGDELVATLRFDDVREVQGRAVPHRWTLTRSAAPKRESRIELREIRFDPGFDDAIFTTHQLLQSGAAAAAGAEPDARLGAPGGHSP